MEDNEALMNAIKNEPSLSQVLKESRAEIDFTQQTHTAELLSDRRAKAFQT
jgi:hypothetical protein